MLKVCITFWKTLLVYVCAAGLMIALIYASPEGYRVKSIHSGLQNAYSAMGRFWHSMTYTHVDTMPIIAELLTTRHIGDIVPNNEFVILPKCSTAITRAISRSTPQGILKGR